MLEISISLDELAVGFTFELLRLPVLPVIIVIAVEAFVLSQLGMRLGARLSEKTRERAQQLAGAALLGLGVVLLVEKLTTRPVSCVRLPRQISVRCPSWLRFADAGRRA